MQLPFHIAEAPKEFCVCQSNVDRGLQGSAFFIFQEMKNMIISPVAKFVFWP